MLPCADQRFFVRGGGGGGGGPRQSDKKGLTTLFVCFVFFAFSLVLSLFYRSQMVNFNEKYHFSRFRRRSKFFQGVGPTFFKGGGVSNCLFPIESHITCDFPEGSGPLSPLWIRTWLRSIKFPSPQNDAITSCTCACFPATSLYVFSRAPQ